MKFFALEMEDITSAQLPELNVMPGFSYTGSGRDITAYSHQNYNPTDYYNLVNWVNKTFDCRWRPGLQDLKIHNKSAGLPQ